MLGKERPVSKIMAKKVFIEMSDALYKESAAKLQVLLDDWQKRHKEQFEAKLENWEDEIRSSVNNIIKEEYLKIRNKLREENLKEQARAKLIEDEKEKHEQGE